ncbi:MAG: hypothetical protein AAFU77_08765 [Myxococcota bacterium]
MKTLPKALRDLVAGLIVERRFGSALLAAGSLPTLDVAWAFVGDFESTWRIDFVGRSVCPIDDSHRLSCPVLVTWALSMERASAYLRGDYRLTDAAGDGSLKVHGSPADRLRFAKAIDALAACDLAAFHTDRSAFLATRARRRSEKPGPGRSAPPTTGVRLRSM